MSNALAKEKSPYLLQHAHNPVDWHPWSEEIFERARTEDIPVFLSVGYATCHWCHVMEKESFENEETAALLNRTFICIKVDREERPDIDALYMSACQMLSGSGGWPLTVLLTPDKRPFFAATYLPKHTRMGRIGVDDLCRQVGHLWNRDRGRVRSSAATVTAHLEKMFVFPTAGAPDRSVMDTAYNAIVESFDGSYGGFDGAPKFPTPHRLTFLLRYFYRSGNRKALDMVTKTLVKMRRGGIWDHVGHGFHRYSTDKHWLLPHFEKMLYDQALMASANLEAHHVTGDPRFAQTAREIFDYVEREMTAPEGAFWSAQDADSEGEEGKFYVWSQAEFSEVLGTEAAEQWGPVFNVAVHGNFKEEATGRATGTNILHRREGWSALSDRLGSDSEQLINKWQGLRRALYHHRKKRIPPLKDDKVLTDWNGLMISALALGGRVLNDRRYTDSARRAADFILTRMRTPEGHLLHRYREGEAGIPATANDYAFMIHGLLNLYMSQFDPALLQTAVTLQEVMVDRFWDGDRGGFYLTAADDGDLPLRPKEVYDGALPSANSLSLLNLAQLSRMTGNMVWEDRAQELSRAFAGTIAKHPQAYTQFLNGLDFVLHPVKEVVIAGELANADTQRLIGTAGKTFTPDTVILVKNNRNQALLAQVAGFTRPLKKIGNSATAHVCKGFACQEPTADVNTMVRLLAQSAKKESLK